MSLQRNMHVLALKARVQNRGPLKTHHSAFRLPLAITASKAGEIKQSLEPKVEGEKNKDISETNKMNMQMAES